MSTELRAAIVQDAETNRVLMLAWMDDEALRLTRETNEAHFFSRSRDRLWRKGETSGNTLAVEELREDCDGDAILLRVRPAGPACHTGSVSCFAPWLWRRVAERAKEQPEGSYVAGLVASRLGGRGAQGRRRRSRGRSSRCLRDATSVWSPRSPTCGSTRTYSSPPADSTRRSWRTSSARRAGGELERRDV